MQRHLATALLAGVLFAAGCDSDPQEALVTLNVSGVVSAEASAAPLDSVRVVLLPPPNLGTYIVDEDLTDVDGRYALTARTGVLPEGFCEQAGGLIFIRDDYRDRIVAFVPPGYEEEAGDDDESILYVSFTCDDVAKSIDVALYEDVPAAPLD